MSENKSPNPINQFSSLIKDFSGFVAAILLYIQALFGIIDTSYPKTVAALTYLVTAIGLWVWRMPRIQEKKSRIKNGKNANQTVSFWDAFKSSSKVPYVLSLGRRRLEGIVLALATLLSIGGAAYKSPAIIKELRGCPIPENKSMPMVIVADFNHTSGPKVAFEDKLFSAMDTQFNSDISICRYQQSVIKETQSAKELGKKFVGDLPDVIVVWGIYDDRGLEISISPNRWKAFETSFEVPTSDSKILEDWSREYLPQLILSEIDYINHDTDKAIRTLDRVINTATNKNLPGENPKAFARINFLLALLHADQYEPEWDANGEIPTPGTVLAAQKIINIYNEVLRGDPDFDSARLNRGVLYSDINETDKALNDFNQLIDLGSPQASDAYAERAYLQPDWELEKKDFLSAIALKPKRTYYYGNLGSEALYARDFDTATRAYKDSIQYLDEESRQLLIDGLNEVMADDPELKDQATAIIHMLQEAKLK